MDSGQGPADSPGNQQREYRGPPERQRNPRAPNIRKDQAYPPAQKKTAPAVLPKGQHRQHGSTSAQPTLKNEPLKRTAFTTDFTVQEKVHVTEFTPSFTNLLQVADETFIQYSTDDPRLERSMIPEVFRYYYVAMMWIRITALKDLQRQPLTNEERNLLSLLAAEKFAIPEPLAIYLKQYGSVVSPTESHLFPAFPPLPIGVVGNFGGYYGPINVDTHNLYEEIPCLGVVAEAVRRAMTNEEPGPYPSTLQTPDLIPTANLLGYQDLSVRLPKAKAKILKLGVTAAAFPEIIPHTGLNIKLIRFVSNWIAQKSTFKVSHITTISMGQGGTTSQLVNNTLVDVDHYPPHAPYNDNEFISFTTCRESASNMGIGLFIGAQVFKYQTPDQTSRPPWACALPPLQPDADEEVPQAPLQPEWLLNANDRQTLPPEYRIRRFIGTTYTPTNYIRLVVERLATAPLPTLTQNTDCELKICIY